jgi:hypothetical protein
MGPRSYERGRYAGARSSIPAAGFEDCERSADFSPGNVSDQDKPSRISLNINARAATEWGLLTSPLASIQNVKELISARSQTT